MNKYSFYIIKKDILSNSVDVSDISDTSNIKLIDTFDRFTHLNEQIVEEYSFESKSISLYRDNGDNTLSLLYESTTDENDEQTNFVFTPHGVYSAFIDKNSILQNVFYSTEKDFNMISEKSEYYNENRLTKYISQHSTPIIIGGRDLGFCDPEHLRTFKRLYMQYTIASKYIPADCIIQEILEIAHHYIATKELDKDLLVTKFNELQHFEDLCYDSISQVSEFINNCENVDFRVLCERLQKNSKNISNLLELYLEDKIEER